MRRCPDARGHSRAQAAAVATVDSGIFNYMLNQEYLMAEFYSCASTGTGIPDSLRLGGPPAIGCTQASLTGVVAVTLLPRMIVTLTVI